MILQPSAIARRRETRVVWSLAPAAVGVLAAALAAVGARRSLSLVEVEDVLRSRRAWSQLVPFEHASASGSLYLVALKGWLYVGSAEWVARAPSIAACGLTAAVVYLLGARLVDRATGLAAGAAFATTAYALDVGRDVGSLGLAVLAVATATWLFAVALETNWLALWGAYVVVAVAASYLHASCATVLVAHAAALVAWTGSPRRAAWSVGLASIVSAPAAVQVVLHRRHVLDALTQPRLGDVLRAVHDVSGRNVALLVAAAIGVVALVAVRFLEVDGWKPTLLVTWAVAPLVAVLVLSMVRPSFDARYLAVSAPAWSLLAGAGIRGSRRELAAVLAVAVVAIGGVRTWQLLRQTPENWRGAVAAAFASKAPENRVVAAPARAIAALAYYAGPDRGSTTAAGPTAFVLVRARDARDAVEQARGAVRPPAYALRAQRRWGRRLWLQRWERTGLPPAPRS